MSDTPSPDDYGDLWWGDFSAPMFPLNPAPSFTPPPVPVAPTPAYTLWGFDNGWIGYLRST